MEPKKLSSSKINPTKLLGGSSFIKNTTNISEKLKEDSITISKSDLSTIKGQVFEIKNLVTDLTTLKKKKLTTARKETEQEKFGEREKELEKKKKPEDNKIKLPQAPKLGFLDIIKRFVVNTLIGFVVVRLIKHLPKLIEVAKFLGSAMDFITDVGGKLLNGLATFVQKGYEAYDFTRKTLKSFGGDNALKLFDGFNNALGGIVTAALAASFALFDMAGGDSRDAPGRRGGGPRRGGGRYGLGRDALGRDMTSWGFKHGKDGGAGWQGFNLAKQRGVAGIGVDKAQGDIMKRYFQKYGRDAFVQRFGEEGLKKLPGGMQRGLLQKGARSAFVSLAGKSGAKAVLKFTRPLLKRLPIIGAVLDFGLSVALGEDPGRAAFKTIGAGLLGTIGAALGGPFALLTGLAGGAIGDAAGATLYDLFFGNKKPNQKVAKAAGGGQPVTRGGKLVGGAPKRTIKKAKRQISIQPTQLKPGADIGGEEKIEKVFPKSKDKKQVSPLDYIEKSYKNTNQDRFFGALLNLQTKSLVGQKPSKVDYANAAQGLSNWMSITFSDEILRTGAVYAAGGGEINADMLAKKSGDMTDAIAKSLEDSISKRLDDNINDLMRQMMLKGIEPEDKDKQKAPDAEDMGEGAGVQVSSDSEDFWLLATAAMFENSHPQGAADVAQVIYNRTQYPAWNAPTIKKAILNPGQFQPVRQYGGTAAWASIKTKEDALRFSKSHGKTQEQLERVAAALLDKQKQQDARTFVGPRDSFRADSYEKANNHLADETEKTRHGHTFGFEPGGAMIGQFKAGKLSAAQVNANIVGNVNLKAGDGRFIQGNSGRSEGTHFHIGTNKPGDGSGVTAAGFNVIKNFLGKKSVYVGRSKETIPANATDEQIRGYIRRGQIAHATRGRGPTELDLQIGGTGAGNKVAFPLALKGMKYSSTDGYGVSADIVGTNAFVGHGRYKPDGTLAPQQGETQLLAGAPDFYAFHGMNKFITKDSLLKVHKGEFISVTDKDSVDILGQDFIATINAIENKSQLKQKVGSLIDHLSYIAGYEPGGEQEIIVDVQEPDLVTMPIPVPVGGGSMIMVGSGFGEDYSQELYSHA